MKNSKKIFFIAAAVFFIILIAVVIDFAKRTEFRKMGGVRAIEEKMDK